ncbi:MAG: DMT family transporter [Polyangiaceae bacterium]
MPAVVRESQQSGTRRSPARAYAWMVLSAVLFATMNVCARTTSGHTDWKIVALTRAMVGAVLAIVVGRARGLRIFPRSTRAMWARSFFGTFALAFTFWVLSNEHLALGDAATLLNLSPLFLAVLGPVVLGERSGRRVFAAIPLAAAGVVLILHPPLLFDAGPKAGMIVPATVAIVSSAFSALAMLSLRRVGPTESPEAIVAHFSTVAFVAMCIITLPTTRIDFGGELTWILVGSLAGGFAQLAMTRAYALEFAARVSPFGYLNVVFTAILGAMLLHDRPTGPALCGMALVITAGVVVTLAHARDERTLRARPATLRS